GRRGGWGGPRGGPPATPRARDAAVVGDAGDVLRCGTHAGVGFLAARPSQRAPSHATHRLSAAARSSGAADLRTDCRCHLERRRSDAHRRRGAAIVIDALRSLNADGRVLVATRFVRLFAYGALSVVLVPDLLRL